MAVFYDRLALAAAIVFLVAFAAIGIFGAGAALLLIVNHLDRPAPRGVAVMAVLGVGILAFRIRVMHRALYGLIEMELALLLSWFGFADVATKSPGLVVGSFVSAVYFMVRGLDNATHNRVALENYFFGHKRIVTPRVRSAAAQPGVAPDGASPRR